MQIWAGINDYRRQPDYVSRRLAGMFSGGVTDLPTQLANAQQRAGVRLPGTNCSNVFCQQLRQLYQAMIHIAECCVSNVEPCFHQALRLAWAPTYVALVLEWLSSNRKLLHFCVGALCMTAVGKGLRLVTQCSSTVCCSSYSHCGKVLTATDQLHSRAITSARCFKAMSFMQGHKWM
jgi:hypothetical protein